MTGIPTRASIKLKPGTDTVVSMTWMEDQSIDGRLTVLLEQKRWRHEQLEGRHPAWL